MSDDQTQPALQPPASAPKPKAIKLRGAPKLKAKPAHVVALVEIRQPVEIGAHRIAKVPAAIATKLVKGKRARLATADDLVIAGVHVADLT